MSLTAPDPAAYPTPERRHQPPGPGDHLFAHLTRVADNADISLPAWGLYSKIITRYGLNPRAWGRGRTAADLAQVAGLTDHQARGLLAELVAARLLTRRPLRQYTDEPVRRRQVGFHPTVFHGGLA